MVFNNLCILIYWVKVALALEGLRASLVVEAMLHHINLIIYMANWSSQLDTDRRANSYMVTPSIDKERDYFGDIYVW